jgi:hypothetical protein
MGKLGDLIVRLKLKYEDYQKGLKQAEKDTKKFGSSFENIKKVGIAAWAAVGAGVIKLGQDLVRATNQAEDSWAMFMTKAKAGWNTFVKTLLNGEWDKFIQKFKEEIAVAQLLQEALDADTEIANSIALKKSYHAEELARLEVIARDITKSEKERAAAAEKYKKIQNEIYTQELERAKLLRKAHYQSFIPGKDEALFTEEVMAMLDQALMLYGETKKIAALGNRTFAQAVDEAFIRTVENPTQSAMDAINSGNGKGISEKDMGAWVDQQALQISIANYVKSVLASIGVQLGKIPVQDWLHSFFKGYETNKNGDEVQSLIASLLGAFDAKGAYKEVTQKMDLLLARVGDHVAKSVEESGINDDLSWLGEIADEPIELPEIDLSSLKDADEQIKAFLGEWKANQEEIDALNKMLEDSIVSAMSNGMQAITDLMFGIEDADASRVLAALLQPFADTMIQMGEMLIVEGLGIKAFQDSLKSLNPAIALAAGATLLALGSALSSGLRKLGESGGSSAGAYSSSSATGSIGQHYQSEMTIYVEGKISGKDIILAGNKTLNGWRR